MTGRGRCSRLALRYIARKTREDIIGRTTAGRKRPMERGIIWTETQAYDRLTKMCASTRLAGERQGAIANSYHVNSSTISRLRDEHLGRCSQPLDFPFQFEFGFQLDPPPYFLAEGFNVCRGRLASVDQVVSV